MGCGASSEEHALDGNERYRHQSQRGDDGGDDHVQSDQKVTLLLLGAGESGKSTIFKQLRIIYGNPREDSELLMYGVVIRSNVVEAFRRLIPHINYLNLEHILNDEEKKAYQILCRGVVDNNILPGSQDPQALQREAGTYYSIKAGIAANQEAIIFLKHVESMKILWKSEAMRQVWSDRAATNVIDGHKLFLDDLDRIANPEYRPDNDDLLNSRIRTNRVIKESYDMGGVEFEVLDVGGQRSERRKWIDCFDKVDSVVFVAALSEYDQTVTEARRTNRMIEAIELFKGVTNNNAFSQTPIILFLNKKDLFAEKLMTKNISEVPYFKDYAGAPGDFDGAVLYFISKFRECLDDDTELHESYIHVCCATDTDNMSFVLDSAKSIIMTDNLARSGFFG